MAETVNSSRDEAPGAGADAVRHGLVGVVRADGDVRVEQSAATITTARGGADLHQAASLAVVSGGDTTMRMAGAVAVPTLGDVRVEMGGAQWVVAAGDVTIEKGGCGAAVAPSVRVDHGVAGVALGWNVDVGEGGRVLFGPLAGLAFGLAFGIGAGLVLAASAGYAARKALTRLPRVPFGS